MVLVKKRDTLNWRGTATQKGEQIVVRNCSPEMSFEKSKRVLTAAGRLLAADVAADGTAAADAAAAAGEAA